MNDINIPSLKVRFQAPSNWNELSPKQLVKVLDILRSFGQRSDVMVKLCYAVLFENQSRFVRWIFRKKLNAEQLVFQLFPLLKFLMEDNKLTKNLFPRLRSGIRFYYGPSDELDNISFYEWICAESYFLQFKRTKKSEYLDKLVAVLYRPKSFKAYFNATDDVRAELSSEITHRVKAQRRISLDIKFAVLAFYEGCRNKTIDDNPDVFPAGGGSGKETNYAELLIEMAGTKFGDLRQTGSTSFNTVLIFLKMNIAKQQNAPKK